MACHIKRLLYSLLIFLKCSSAISPFWYSFYGSCFALVNFLYFLIDLSNILLTGISGPVLFSSGPLCLVVCMAKSGLMVCQLECGFSLVCSFVQTWSIRVVDSFASPVLVFCGCILVGSVICCVSPAPLMIVTSSSMCSLSLYSVQVEVFCNEYR